MVLKKTFFVLLLAISLLSVSFSVNAFQLDNMNRIGMANPASVNCVDNGGKLDIRDTGSGQVGYCIFDDGSECEEWAFYRGECSKGEHFSNEDKENVKNILFVHGMGADKKDWDIFAEHAKKKGYNVFRTDTSRCGSVSERAKILAEYINTLDVPDNSLKAVGHSMGGIDLRYLVGEAHAGHEPFLSAAKKIKKVYTIATPHGGSFGLQLGSTQVCLLRIGGDCKIHAPIQLSDAIGEVSACSRKEPAWKDLSDEGMAEFNKKYPYSEFSVEGRKIPFLAFHFQAEICGGTSDCAVGTAAQTWDGAPKQPGPSISAVHSKDIHDNICTYWKNIGCGACDAQCSSCECRNVDMGFVHETICPPFKDKCDSLCNECRSACSVCPSQPSELSMTNVLDVILKDDVQPGIAAKLASSDKGTQLHASVRSREQQGNSSGTDRKDDSVNHDAGQNSDTSTDKGGRKISDGNNGRTENPHDNDVNSQERIRSKHVEFRIGNMQDTPVSVNITSFKGKPYSMKVVQKQESAELNFRYGNKDVVIPVYSDFRVENNTIYLLDNSSHNLGITPPEVYDEINSLRSKAELGIEGLSLGLENGKPVYRLRLREPAKLFWIFPATVESSYTISADDGTVKLVSKPWYATGLKISELWGASKK